MVATSLALFAACYFGGLLRLWRTAGRGKGISTLQALAFGAGWLSLVVALLSPLHELSETLLSAHMVQHELLMIVAAPLIAFSAPGVATLWLVKPIRLTAGSEAAAVRHIVPLGWKPGALFARLLAAITAPATVWLLHFVALWLWHLPALYQAALASEPIHAAQHLCFFGTACLFWWGIGHGRYGRLGYGAAVVYIFATAMHSGVLGALLTFSPSLWYPIYATASPAGRLSPLEDQQLAGLVMWIPSGVIFLGVGLAFLAAWIRESERRVRITTTAALLAVTMLASTACDKSPAEKYARLIEQSAAWASAGKYAEELRQENLVPDAYLKSVIDTGWQETQQLHQPLNESKDVSSDIRDKAGALNDQVWQLFDSATRTQKLDDQQLQQLYTALRRLAETVRSSR